ncbi:MAG: phosphoribosylanthranilate isomerase [Prevotella sp.]|nr:phosphoribosylanthranilate isomerase [Prevotella sp.]
MIIKVCGMREPENIRAVEQLGIQWMGFIFWPQSSRCVKERPAYLPTKCKRVGVFVDATITDIRANVEEYELDCIQLHGHESPAFIQSIDYEVPIIKAFSIATTADLTLTASYEGVVDYFLFDTKAKLVGGNGTKFDWSVLQAYHGTTPFLLSGGIGPDDVERIRQFHHPQLAGIDLNSRFEISPALNDITKLKHFIYELQQNQ